MGLLVVALIVTNLVTIAVLVIRYRTDRRGEMSGEVFTAPRPPGVRGRERRLITIEILNPIELATTRGGRVAGLAGTLVPALTRRLVYDQTLKTLRRELDDKAVHADVRVHTLRAATRGSGAAPSAPTPSGRPVVDVVAVDEVAPIDLSKAPPD